MLEAALSGRGRMPRPINKGLKIVHPLHTGKNELFMQPCQISRYIADNGPNQKISTQSIFTTSARPLFRLRDLGRISGQEFSNSPGGLNGDKQVCIEANGQLIALFIIGAVIVIVDHKGRLIIG